ncbi:MULTISPECIES: carbon storage regulator CsrA [unclassified Sporosarcina]|uniref:carbon storage regulator CsrA n=1 Tax=unclassified Sporosarcina TaxID=2647733 RepID=UPI000C1715C9|nr:MULTISPECIES: carbon storage regulator CsrA [unclassified Sporosarcina]PID05008.1 carbon storage regulator [Sporosarcina sp. P30]PID08008.1 carbon storage regulator [Sporosarcina sp. P31]PID11762.1 carbon storage regulator [Sporosarcina sp. P32b]
MLVLSRKVGDTIKIADNIEVKILEVKGDTVRVGIEAPKSVEIVRGELIQSIKEINTESLTLDLDWYKNLKDNK